MCAMVSVACETTQVHEQAWALVLGFAQLYCNVPGGQPSFCAFPIPVLAHKVPRGRILPTIARLPLGLAPSWRRLSTPVSPSEQRAVFGYAYRQ